MKPLLLLISFTLLWANTCPEGTQIARIELLGLETTQNHIIFRELQTTTQEKLNCKTLEIDIQKLMNLDIFTSVKSSFSDGAPTTLTLTFKELPAYLGIPTIGKADIEGWLLGAGFATLNFLGQDIRSEFIFKTNVHPEFNTLTELSASVELPWLGTLPLKSNFLLIRSESQNSFLNFLDRGWLIQLEHFYRFTDWISAGAEFQYLQKDHTEPKDWMSLSDLDQSLLWTAGIKVDTRRSKLNAKSGFLAFFKVGWNDYLNSSNSHSLFSLDLRNWVSTGKHILHNSQFIQYREGEVPFYQLYFHGGANTLRGYAPSSERFSKSEWLSTIEYRYEFFDESEFTLPLLNWNLSWGIQYILGLDRVQQWGDSNSSVFLSPYSGIHILLPALQRVRFEIGLESYKLDYQFQIGLYEKSDTQTWSRR